MGNFSSGKHVKLYLIMSVYVGTISPTSPLRKKCIVFGTSQLCWCDLCCWQPLWCSQNWSNIFSPLLWSRPHQVCQLVPALLALLLVGPVLFQQCQHAFVFCLLHGGLEKESRCWPINWHNWQLIEWLNTLVRGHVPLGPGMPRVGDCGEASR